jgi:hypothetical protein
MRTVAIALILAAVPAFASAQAGPDEHAAHHPQAASASAPASGATGAGDLEQKQQAMQALVEKLEKTRNASERQRLLDEHRQAMNDQVAALKRLKCAGMRMNGGGMGQRPQGEMMMGGEMMKCHETMQVRTEMLLGLMEQMMRHEDARQKTR